MRLSVIIPTYNRASLLQKSLECLEKQTEQDFEIIVVDDGSTDQTEKVVKIFQKKSKIPVSYFYQKNQKQGVARNLGIQKAQTDLILFLQDDIFAQPYLVAEHFSIHQTFNEENIAVLGYTTWDPFLEINDYMKFLEWSGWQFNYNQIKEMPAFQNFYEYKSYNHKGKFLDPKKQFWFFYTSNLSLKKTLLEKEEFDPDFQNYGWEDIELGWRLTQKENVHLFFNPEAAAFHHHPQEESEFENKITNLARGLQKIPALRPPLWKKVIFGITLPLFSLLPLSYNWQMWIKGKKSFYQTLK